MKRSILRNMKKVSAVVVGAGASVVAASSAFAVENALTTAAALELSNIKADTVTIGTVMVGVACTLAIAAIIFAVIKKH